MGKNPSYEAHNPLGGKKQEPLQNRTRPGTSEKKEKNHPRLRAPNKSAAPKRVLGSEKQKPKIYYLVHGRTAAREVSEKKKKKRDKTGHERPSKEKKKKNE